MVELRAAFIPQGWIVYFRTSEVIIYYNGNNREFTYYTENQPEKSKMVQHIICNFENQTLRHFRSTGPTIERTVDRDTGEVLQEIEDHAPTSGLTIADERINSNSASFYLRGHAGNPLNTDAPAIDWEYTVDVNSSGIVTLDGRHDGYPAHEIYKRLDNGAPVELYRHDPRVSGEGPESLFPPMGNDFRGTF
ncbi:DUF3238 domain-containing protein [Litoribacterium kuwaitense]|uniref:DUF3238 domain-containing protein n=1 Tax=Litoribacterium kuwaitense TaxID=1398745 RepID=UPI0028AE6C71|nr:DUF3238 domain-containing protein [Litoribacterium kuwaitense]